MKLTWVKRSKSSFVDLKVELVYLLVGWASEQMNKGRFWEVLQEGELGVRNREEQSGLSSFHFESSKFILATVMWNCTVYVIWAASSCDLSQGI